jgi:hypothetical protein
MATIPLGNAGRALPGRMPGIRTQPAGMAVGRALEQAGNVGVQVGLQAQADESRLQQQAMREQQQEAARQAQVAEAAERAREALALQTAEDMLIDTHDQLGAEVLQGRTSKDKAGEAWAERSRKVLDESLGGFREQTRGLAAGRLEGTTLRLGNTLRRTVEKKDRQDITADMTTRLERLSRDYMANPGQAEAEAMTLFDQLGPLSDMPADQLSRARQSWKEQAQYTAAFDAVSRGRADRRQLGEAEKLIGNLRDLDPQRKAQLLDRAQGYRLAMDQQEEMRQARAARAAEASMRRAEAEFNTLQALADKGTALAPEYVDKVIAATAGTPYQAGVRQLMQQARDTGGLAAQPLAVQRAQLTALDAEIAQRGRSPELDRRREQLEKVLRGTESDVKAEPLEAALQRGVISALPPLNLQAGLEGIVAQLGQRVTQAGSVGQWAGQAVSPLTGDEAQQMARLLQSQPPAAKAQSLAAVAAVIPPAQAQALAAQIDAKDRPLALALAAGTSQTTQGRTVSELILRGAQAVADKSIKEEKGAEFGTRALVAKEVGEALAGKAREDVIDAARLIYLGKQASGEAVTAQGAVRLAIGGDIVEHNGKRVPVPAGLDEEALRDRLVRMPASRISAQAPDGFVYLLGGRPMGVPEFLVALPDAQLEPAGLGRYVVRSGGSLVLNNERRPIVVDVR